MAAENGDALERAGWLKKAGESCRIALKWGKVIPFARPEAMRCKGRYEWLKGNHEEARRWWQKSLDEAEQWRMPYEAGLTHLEIGQRLGKVAPEEREQRRMTPSG